jgi:Cu+-exporting ATPase
MNKLVLKISGMHCSSCAKVIKFGLEELNGITSVNVDFGSKKVELEFNSTKINIPEIKNKVESLGYKTYD